MDFNRICEKTKFAWYWFLNEIHCSNFCEAGCKNYVHCSKVHFSFGKMQRCLQCTNKSKRIFAILIRLSHDKISIFALWKPCIYFTLFKVWLFHSSQMSRNNQLHLIDWHSQKILSRLFPVSLAINAMNCLSQNLVNWPFRNFFSAQ